MSSLNQATLIGNLGRDPEVRYMPSGDAVVNFSIATSERWKDKKSGEWQEKTEWHDCSFFGPTAEFVGKYAQKGSKVLVIGSIHKRKYEKDGVEKIAVDIKGREFKILSGGVSKDESSDGGGDTRATQQRTAAAPASTGGGGSAMDDDIPFAALRHDLM
jgi:single-strand DNA-binding protein